MIVFDTQLRFSSTEVMFTQSRGIQSSSLQCLKIKLSPNGSTYYMLSSFTWNPMFGTPQGLEQCANWLYAASNWLGGHSQNTCLCSGFMRGEGLTPLDVWGNSRAVSLWSICCTLWVEENRVSLELCLPGRKWTQWSCCRCLISMPDFGL